jgi:hypothetical protein
MVFGRVESPPKCLRKAELPSWAIAGTKPVFFSVPFGAVLQTAPVPSSYHLCFFGPMSFKLSPTFLPSYHHPFFQAITPLFLPVLPSYHLCFFFQAITFTFKAIT